MQSQVVPLDKRRYAEMVVAEGRCPIDAYRQLTNSEATDVSVKKALNRLHDNDEYQDIYNRMVQEKARGGITKIIQLTDDAIQVYKDILADPKAKLKDKKSVADTIISLTQQVLPKEVKHNHNHKVDEDLDELVQQLLGNGNSARIIEGALTPESRPCKEAEFEAEGASAQSD